MLECYVYDFGETALKQDSHSLARLGSRFVTATNAKRKAEP